MPIMRRKVRTPSLAVIPSQPCSMPRISRMYITTTRPSLKSDSPSTMVESRFSTPCSRKMAITLTGSVGLTIAPSNSETSQSQPVSERIAAVVIRMQPNVPSIAIVPIRAPFSRSLAKGVFIAPSNSSGGNRISRMTSSVSSKCPAPLGRIPWWRRNPIAVPATTRPTVYGIRSLRVTSATSIAPSNSSSRSSSSGSDCAASSRDGFIRTPSGKRVPRDGGAGKDPCPIDLDTI